MNILELIKEETISSVSESAAEILLQMVFEFIGALITGIADSL